MSSIHSHSQGNSIPLSREKDKVRLFCFLAHRIYRDTDRGKQVSYPTVLIVMIGITISLAVTIIAVSIVIGFGSEVYNKMIGFGSYIQVSSFNAAGSYETHPVMVDDSMMVALSARPEVKHVQRYSTRPGMIKTDDAFQGVILESIGPEFGSAFFRDHLVEGEIPVFSDTASTNQVVISKTITGRLKLKLGDKICAHFIQRDMRARRLTVKGIYRTNFSKYDNFFLLTDSYLVNRLNNRAPGRVSGAGLQVRNYDKLEDMTYGIAVDTGNKQDVYRGTYYVQSIEQVNPQIFAWLGLPDLNVWVILALMIGVADSTMTSGLLIVILERTQIIGILKTLGANGFTIHKVFLQFSAFLIGKGMLWGNAVGTTFCILQSQLGLFKLDPETYYVSVVPVSIDTWLSLLINAGTLLASVLVLVGPPYLMTKINPANSMWCEQSNYLRIESPFLRQRRQSLNFRGYNGRMMSKTGSVKQ